MSSRWRIPKWLEEEVRARDKNCVYCRVEMLQKVPRGGPRKTLATWEHIINDARIVTRENIALCCSGCNSSKGHKVLANWLESAYCVSRGINEGTVAQIVRDALRVACIAPNQSMKPAADRCAARMKDEVKAELALGSASCGLSCSR
jgi:hypothetical protein